MFVECIVVCEIFVEIVYEDEIVIVFFDIEFVNCGYMLICLKQFYVNFVEVFDDVMLNILYVVRCIYYVLFEVYGFDGISFL